MGNCQSSKKLKNKLFHKRKCDGRSAENGSEIPSSPPRPSGTGMDPSSDSAHSRLHFGFREGFPLFYKLGAEVGRGQFGTTYAGTHLQSGETCGVKIIRKKALNSKEAVEDVKREVKVMRALNGHQNIVTLYDVFEDARQIYLVMELCTGGELFEAVLQRGSFSEQDAADLLAQILTMVAQCHLKGVIHRDIKPENLLFAEPKSLVLKLTDFGLSEFFSSPSQRFTDVVGSAYYVAPEVLRRQYTAACDVWSVGIIGYILLSGRPPFWSQTETGIFNEILKTDPDFAADPWPRISADARSLVQSLLAKDPRARPTAAQALSHPFIRDRDLVDRAPLDASVLNALRQYTHADKLKRLFLRRVAETFSDDEVRGLRDQFAALDLDGDGSITRHEMLGAIRQLRTGERGHLVIPESQVDDIVDALDADHSGRIDFLEFLSAALQTNVGLMEKGDREGWRRHTREAFNRIDRDGNGTLSVDELAAELGGDPELSELLKRADKNHDGVLDFSEFLDLLRERSSALMQRPAWAVPGTSAAAGKPVFLPMVGAGGPGGGRPPRPGPRAVAVTEEEVDMFPAGPPGAGAGRHRTSSQ